MTNSNKPEYIETDESGRLIIPASLAKQLGFKQKSRLRIAKTRRGLEIASPARLEKIYIEPTNLCNLDCLTCMRNSWHEPMGKMSMSVFDRIVAGLSDLNPVPSVFIGGLGEPLLHPNIVDMVRRIKNMGTTVEMITNGTLLTREISQQLCKARLDMLWVSLDGAKPESYADVRLGAALPQVLENMANFRDAMRLRSIWKDDCDVFHPTQMGIAFVAMKRNIADLPEIIKLGQQYGVDKFHISNVIPYTKEMIGEVLYYGALNNIDEERLIIPGLDINATTSGPLYQTMRNLYGNLSGSNINNVRNHCPFIDNGTGAIGWDGNFSPCLPLLHDYTSYNAYVHFNERHSHRWAIGNLTEHTLSELWNTPEHLAFRERVQFFDFSPCTYCGSCDRAESNEEDCFGNTYPTCGGCLWAQGVIQCP